MTLIGSGTITRKLVGSASLNTLSPTTVGGIEIDLLEGGDSGSSFSGESPATVQITVRKDTNDNWVANNPILAAGEIGYIIEDKQFFVGDGTTAYTDLTDANYIVHWNDFVSALNSFDSRFTSIESNVSTLQSDVSTAQSDISALQSKVDGQDTFLSQLQQGLNDVVDDVSTQQSSLNNLSNTVSSLQTDLTNNVSDLQGQIDTLSGGVMKRFELSINLADIDGVAENNLEIIVPTSGKAIMPLHACSLIVSDNLSVGQSSIKIKSENDNNIFEDLIISDDGSWNGLTIMQLPKTPAPLSGIDGKVYLYFTFGDTWTGANGTLKLMIFYMEV